LRSPAANVGAGDASETTSESAAEAARREKRMGEF
jgi:hypothetical protein